MEQLYWAMGIGIKLLCLKLLRYFLVSKVFEERTITNHQRIADGSREFRKNEIACFLKLFVDGYVT